MSNPVLEQLDISEKIVDSYVPDEDAREFLMKTYRDLEKDIQLKEQPLKILNDRSLQTYWDDSNDDYNVYVPPQRSDDWMKQYRRPLSRDKANALFSHLAQQLIVPEVMAQNKEQEIDRSVSRALRGLLEHADTNDGAPSDSGSSKFVRIVHKGVIEGTIHVQDDMVDGKAFKDIVPNEEVFVPNYWQPDIQKQGHLIRFQTKVHYEEAKAEFGDLPNFKYVRSGALSGWDISKTEPKFKEIDVGLLTEDEVHIIRVWRPAGKKQKLFNVIVNGVLLLGPENKSPYKHGMYPIYKEVLELIDARFYWGRSLPDKARSDQAIYDAFYTIILNKAKLNLLPPMVSMNGLHVDQDIVVPGKITSITENIDNLKRVPGVAEPITQSDVNILGLLEKSIDTSTSSPIIAGQSGEGERTAREAILQEANAQKLLGLFGLMIANLIRQGAYLRLRNIIQFYPRNKVNEISKVVVPGQILGNGKTGALEVLFKRPPTMSADELLEMSTEMLREEEAAAERGEPKEKMIIDPSYLEDLDLFIVISPNATLRKSDALEKALEIESYQLLAANPLVNQEENTRGLIRALGKNEDLLILARQEAQAPLLEGLKTPEKGGLNAPASPMEGATRQIQGLQASAKAPTRLPNV